MSLVKPYFVSIHGAIWSLNHDEVSAVVRRGQVAPLPWAPAGVVGLIDSDGDVLPLLSLDTERGAAQPVPLQSLCAIISLPVGRVAVDIEHIQEDPASDGCTAPPLADRLRTQTAEFSSTQAGPRAKQARQSSSTGPRETFLHVRGGPLERAVPAIAGCRVDKPVSITPLDPPGNAYWVAELDDGLLGCTALGACRPPPGDATTSPWCIRLEGPAGAEGILVDEVIGLIQVDASRIRQLNHQGESSIWLTMPGRPPLRVLDLPGLQPSHRGTEAFLPARPPGGVHPETPAGATAEEVSARHALSLAAGKYRLAVPKGLLGPVLGPLPESAIGSSRRRGSLPVVDLRRAFDCPPPTNPGFAVTLKAGARRLILLADHAEVAAREPAFSLPPPLPATLSPHVRGVRLLGGQCELLLRENISLTAWAMLKRNIHGKAFLGWMDQPH